MWWIWSYEHLFTQEYLFVLWYAYIVVLKKLRMSGVFSLIQQYFFGVLFCCSAILVWMMHCESTFVMRSMSELSIQSWLLTSSTWGKCQTWQKQKLLRFWMMSPGALWRQKVNWIPIFDFQSRSVITSSVNVAIVQNCTNHYQCSMLHLWNLPSP
jgi:hypothetical protein